MKRPYIICHMMTSVDGRIDCAMTEKLPGVEDYYKTLGSFSAKAELSGRVTAEYEMALPGKFVSDVKTSIDKESFYKASDSNLYTVILDTKGSLLWEDQKNKKKPLIVVTSTNASLEYLEYLKSKNISWIACGSEHIDLTRATEILLEEFNIEKMVVVGGGNINAGFLSAGLLDEISILIGAGIDGRDGMTSVFDGLPKNTRLKELKLIQAQALKSGAVWIRYKVQND